MSRPPLQVLYTDVLNLVYEWIATDRLEPRAGAELTLALASLSCHCSSCLAQAADDVEDELPF